LEGGAGHTTRLIVVDASVVVSAALRPNGVPRQELDHAVERERIVLSRPVLEEMREVLGRPKFSSVLTPGTIDEIVSAVSTAALWFSPIIKVNECRDPGDDMHLELALAAEASILISSDHDLLAWIPGAGSASCVRRTTWRSVNDEGVPMSARGRGVATPSISGYQTARQ
jgi:putative PIN family toxin of toxin-antitoxin system